VTHSSFLVLTLVLAASGGCAIVDDAAIRASDTAREETLAEAKVRFIHGAPVHGAPAPAAIAGYRIGTDALARFKLDRAHGRTLFVVVRSLREPRWAAVADGFMAATGVSPGNLNIFYEEVSTAAEMAVFVTHLPTERTLTYELASTVRARVLACRPEEYPSVAHELLSGREDSVFVVVEGDARSVSGRPESVRRAE
jgi:hypothetical protein